MCTFFVCFVNSVCFATCLNQVSCNRGKTDGETKKSNTKYFFQSELKTFVCFSAVSFAEKHEGSGDTQKNLIKNFKFLLGFSRFSQA